MGLPIGNEEAVLLFAVKRKSRGDQEHQK